jgi:FtsP/CotA-like multicopper oxidase with cupredoxin domain
VHADFWNALDETSIIHWHGLRVDANNDGNPHYAVEPGEIYNYRIGLVNRAATCWYHPHPHGLSAASSRSNAIFHNESHNTRGNRRLSGFLRV